MKAFPYIEQIGIQDVAGYKGMDLRDYFAAKAMLSFAQFGCEADNDYWVRAAKASYKMADAMMKAREK
jgi:hypothetical protein